MEDLGKWWSSLTVAQKERIARKAGADNYTYPACTAYWQSLAEERRAEIHDHCVDKHGYLLKEWKEGNPFDD